MIFLAHLWLCVPFMALWLTMPSAHSGIREENFKQIAWFCLVVVAYMVVRTWLAFRDPPRLEWEYVFPPIDVAIVSMLIWLGERDPLSNIALLYFFPLAAAAGTLNLRWSITVAAMVLGGAALATHGLRSTEPFNTVFRYFFIFVLSSLVTLLALAAARLREQLSVARDRNRVAMEMHDGVQAHLMTVSKQFELVEHIAPNDPNRAVQLASDGRESARLAADELRYLVHRMRSPSLSEGFIPALRSFMQGVADRHDLELEFSVSGSEQRLSSQVEHAAFRIAQESINNVLRHAGATQACVLIQYEADRIRLSVSDNGCGFNPDVESDGLMGMRTRAESLGGTLHIQSRKEGGSRIEATLPLGESDA